jgi:hypothetical protein
LPLRLGVGGRDCRQQYEQRGEGKPYPRLLLQLSAVIVNDAPLRYAGICSRSCLTFSPLDSTPLSFQLDMFQQLRPMSQLERSNVRLGCAVSEFCSASGGETGVQ